MTLPQAAAPVYSAIACGALPECRGEYVDMLGIYALHTENGAHGQRRETCQDT